MEPLEPKEKPAAATGSPPKQLPFAEAETPAPLQLVTAPGQTTALVPKAPDGLTTIEQTQLETEARTLAGMIVESAGSRTFTLQIEDLGRPEIAGASQRISFLEQRVSRSSQQTASLETGIPEASMKMRKELDRLHPDPPSQSWVTRMIAKVPVVGEPIADWWMESGLREFQLQRETVREQIEAVKASLEANAASLREDSRQLATLHDTTTASALADLRKRAYVLELLVEQLTRTLADIPAEQETHRARVQTAIERLTVRAMFLRRTEYRLQNGLATVDVILDGNAKVADALDMVVFDTGDYLPLALSALSAQARQKRALAAKQAAAEGVQEVMERTVDMADKGAREVAKAYYGSDEEDRRIAEAHRKLLGTLTYLEQASREGMIHARTAIRRYTEMTEQLRLQESKLRAANELGHPEEGERS